MRNRVKLVMKAVMTKELITGSEDRSRMADKLSMSADETPSWS